MSVPTFLIRTVGLGAAALVGYDTHQMAKRRAKYATRNDVSENLTDILVRNISTGTGSQVTELMKDKYATFRMDDSTIPRLQYLKNRIGTSVEAIALNAVGLGLAATALLAKSTSKVRLYKGIVPKPVAAAAAIGLGILGAGSFAKNVLGWGRTDYPVI